jgi:hypothetical protein
VESARPPGPASAYAAELAYFPGIADQVLAAGIADERFDPDILEAAARSATAAWAAAVSGTAPHDSTTPHDSTDTDGAAGPRPVVAADLLRPGGPGARTRLVVREPVISRIQVAHLIADAEPPVVGLVVDIKGRRCIEDSDTGDPISGQPDQLTWFYEFWNLTRDGPAARPWRLGRGRDPHHPDLLPAPAPPAGPTLSAGPASPAAPTLPAAPAPPAGLPPPAAPPPRRFQVTCGFFEHDVHFGSGASIVARLMQDPSPDEAVQLILPAVIADITRFTGLSDWRPTLTSMSVSELPG